MSVVEKIVNGATGVSPALGRFEPVTTNDSNFTGSSSARAIPHANIVAAANKKKSSG
ncbi:MAG TPA: hypothetical protein VEA63_15430 [Opitutus sp.]|jgi:hypothetical protein|nr:hypothetical protein [Opitutus sp.]